MTEIVSRVVFVPEDTPIGGVPSPLGGTIGINCEELAR